jgi:hypothetical protein
MHEMNEYVGLNKTQSDFLDLLQKHFGLVFDALDEHNRHKRNKDNQLTYKMHKDWSHIPEYKERVAEIDLRMKEKIKSIYFHAILDSKEALSPQFFKASQFLLERKYADDGWGAKLANIPPLVSEEEEKGKWSFIPAIEMSRYEKRSSENK